MLGGYDYYFLTQHGGNANEPRHLSRRASSPPALIEKNHRILASMVRDLGRSALPGPERHLIVVDVVLPRVLVRQRYLRAIANAEPADGEAALRGLAALMTDPVLADLDPGELRKGFTAEHLAAITRQDLPGLRQLMKEAAPPPKAPVQPAERWRGRVRGSPTSSPACPATATSSRSSRRCAAPSASCRPPRPASRRSEVDPRGRLNFCRRNYTGVVPASEFGGTSGAGSCSSSPSRSSISPS